MNYDDCYKFIEECKKLQSKLKEYEQLKSENEKLFKLLDCRAGKLLLKDKRFIVVAVDEPYFMEVYLKIRESEKAKGTWSESDEIEYREAQEEWMRLRERAQLPRPQWVQWIKRAPSATQVYVRYDAARYLIKYDPGRKCWVDVPDGLTIDTHDQKLWWLEES